MWIYSIINLSYKLGSERELGDSCLLVRNLQDHHSRGVWVTRDLSCHGPLNNWWRRLNIAAQSIYPKHSRAVIYLKLSFPDCCFLLLLLGSRPSLIIANPGHLAFHYRHSGRKGRQEQPVCNNTTSHTRRGRGSQFTGTHRHKEDSQTGSCVMLKATVAMLENKMNWTRKICFCIPWFGLEYVPCWIWYTQNHTHTPAGTHLSQIYLTGQSNHLPPLQHNVHTHLSRGPMVHNYTWIWSKPLFPVAVITYWQHSGCL